MGWGLIQAPQPQEKEGSRTFTIHATSTAKHLSGPKALGRDSPKGRGRSGAFSVAPQLEGFEWQGQGHPGSQRDRQLRKEAGPSLRPSEGPADPASASALCDPGLNPRGDRSYGPGQLGY